MQRSVVTSREKSRLFFFQLRGRGGGAKQTTCIGQSLHGDGWSPVTDSHLRDAGSHVTVGHTDRLDSRLIVLPKSR